MSGRVRTIARATLALAAAACTAAEAGEEATLSGRVRDERGAPVAGALVTLRHERTGRAITVYTDERGRWALAAHADEGTLLLEARGPAAEQLPRATAVPSGATTDLTLGPVAAHDEPAASRFLAQLPDGTWKRRFLVDCGGCHTFNPRHARKDGRERTVDEWHEALARMLGSFGPGTGFPIVSAAADADADARRLSGALAGAPWPASVAPPAEATRRARGAELTEYPLPVAQDLPHDLAVAPDGRVVVTGMLTHRMYVLDPATARFDTVVIPVERSNPRAVDIDALGRWWVLLGAPRKAARYDPSDGTWAVYDLGTYPHSLAFDRDGGVWYNGHFSVAPEVVGVLDAETGERRTFAVPPAAQRWAGESTVPYGLRWAGESTVPYGLRVGPDGLVWGTQLRGNGLVRVDPRTGEVRRLEMPTAESGPRRLDVAPDGTVWVPEFGAGRVARFDPRTERFVELDFPVPDAAPYVVRVDRRRGTVWIGTGHADVIAALDPATGAFTVYPLPTRGALVRHVDVDEETGDLWAAYGASPGVPAKILRIHRP